MDKFYITLYITAAPQGMVRVNGQILGDTASPVVASVSLGDTVYIEWLSMVPAYSSCFVKLEFDGGELVESPVPSYCRVFLFEENVFEVDFNPPKNATVSRIIPHIVCQRNYVFEKINYSASIYYDSGYIFCVENQYDFSIVFAQYIDFDFSSAQIDLHFIAGTWFVCAHSSTQIAVVKHTKALELIYLGEGSLDFKDNALTLATSFKDPTGRMKIIQYSLKNNVLGVRSFITKMDTAKISTEIIAIHAFLYSIQYDLYDDACFFLDQSLVNQSSKEDFKNYFGEFELIRTPTFQKRIKPPNFCVALARRLCENIYVAKTYFFEVTTDRGTFKIANISE